MSASKDPSPVPIAGGEPCPKCGRPMQRFEHSPGWKPLPGRGHFAWWDRCVPCAHFQNYAIAHRDAEVT